MTSALCRLGIALVLLSAAAAPAGAEDGVETHLTGLMMGQPSSLGLAVGAEYSPFRRDWLTLGVGLHLGALRPGSGWLALAYGGPEIGLRIPVGAWVLEPNVMIGGAYLAGGENGGFSTLMAPRLKVHAGGSGVMIAALAPSGFTGGSEPNGISGLGVSFFLRR